MGFGCGASGFGCGASGFGSGAQGLGCRQPNSERFKEASSHPKTATGQAEGESERERGEKETTGYEPFDLNGCSMGGGPTQRTSESDQNSLRGPLCCCVAVCVGSLAFLPMETSLSYPHSNTYFTLSYAHSNVARIATWPAALRCCCAAVWVRNLALLPTQQRGTLCYTQSNVAHCFPVLLCCCVGRKPGCLARTATWPAVLLWCCVSVVRSG